MRILDRGRKGGREGGREGGQLLTRMSTKSPVALTDQLTSMPVSLSRMTVCDKRGTFGPKAKPAET